MNLNLNLLVRTERQCDYRATRSDRWSQRELQERERYRDTNRQRAWEAGRILAREMLWEAGLVNSRDCEILSREQEGKQVRPNVFEHGRRLPLWMSLSHAAGYVTVAISPDPCQRVGVDLTEIHTVSSAFLRSWFTPQEQDWIQQQPARAAIVWGAKEAIYKTFSNDESFQPLQVEYYLTSENTWIARYRGADLSNCCRIEMSTPVDQLKLIVVTAHPQPLIQTEIVQQQAQTERVQNSLSEKYIFTFA